MNVMKIRLSTLFVRTEKESLQSRIKRAQNKGMDFSEFKEVYLEIAALCQKIKYNKRFPSQKLKLTKAQITLLAKHYKTYKNEMSDRSIRYEL